MVWVSQKILILCIRSIKKNISYQPVIGYFLVLYIYKKFNMKDTFRMRKTRDKVVAHDQNVSFVEE